MIHRSLLLISILTVLLISACQEDDVTPKVKYWYENIGSDKTVPLLPDSNVNYFLYTFLRKKGDAVGIRIKGQYGHARYMSYNIYDNSTLGTVGSIVDRRILPDAGSLNPFEPGADPNTPNRNYTVNIFPRGSADSSAYPNSLLFDDNLENIGLILRYYIPEGDPYAKVALPELEAFDVNTGETFAAPKPPAIDFDAQFREKYKTIGPLLNLASLLEGQRDLFFYRFSGLFLYPNLDNFYLFSPVTFSQNKVVMLRFKAPTFPLSNNDYDDAEVRYFSICLSDNETYTYSTRTDLEFKIAGDGFINIVIGPDDPALREKAEGLNFITLPPELYNNKKGVIVYRNLLTKPGFPYSMALVPDVSQNISLENILNISVLQGQTYIGDYAPVARKMSRAQFLDNFGGFPVSY